MIKDGVLRLGDPEAEKEAWEETVRLRERMFWARVGGGVVPAFVGRKNDKNSPILKRVTGGEDSPRPSQEAPSRTTTDGATETPETPVEKKPEDVFGDKLPSQPSTDSLESSSTSRGNDTADEAENQLKRNLRDSLQSNASTTSTERALTPIKSAGERSLKVAIPGSFE